MLKLLSWLVSLATLTTSPFNLVKGEDIFHKAVASNFLGDSKFSETSFAGFAQLVPVAPFNLEINVSST